MGGGLSMPMSKKLCVYHKKKGTWTKGMCLICGYAARCKSKGVK